MLIDGSAILKLNDIPSDGIESEKEGSLSVGRLMLIDGSAIRKDRLIPSSGIDNENEGSLSVGS
jgi:hypothetical protein